MKLQLASLAIAATLLTITGCGAVAEATTSNPAPTSTARPANIQEDDPGWDCLLDGNKVCGANPIERTEAWGLFSPQFSEPALDGNHGDFRVTYVGIANEGNDFPPSQYLTIPSQITPAKVHVFTIEAGGK